MTEVITPRAEWAMVCDYALVDGAGKLSVLGIFDRLFAVNFPAAHPTMYFVAQWSGAAGGAVDSELRIWGPSKELIGTGLQHVELGPTGRSAAIIQLSPVPLPSPGEFVFELLGAGITQTHVTIAVEQTPQQ